MIAHEPTAPTIEFAQVPEVRQEPATQDAAHGKAEREKAPPAFVRLSVSQHQRLKRDAERSGMSIPTLLKTAYFKREVVRQLMTKEAMEGTMAVLHKVSNLLNHVCQKLDAGFREGFNPELSKALEQIYMLRCYVGGIYGSR